MGIVCCRCKELCKRHILENRIIDGILWVMANEHSLDTGSEFSAVCSFSYLMTLYSPLASWARQYLEIPTKQAMAVLNPYKSLHENAARSKDAYHCSKNDC